MEYRVNEAVGCECLRLLRSSVTAGARTYDPWIATPTPYRLATTPVLLHIVVINYAAVRLLNICDGNDVKALLNAFYAIGRHVPGSRGRKTVGKTSVAGLPIGENHTILRSLVLTYYQRVTDRQTTT